MECSGTVHPKSGSWCSTTGGRLKGRPELADRAETADHIHKDATDRYAPCLRGGLYVRCYSWRLILLFLRYSCEVEMSFNNNII